MRETLQPILIRTDDGARRSPGSMPRASARADRRSRLATTLTLTGLGLIAIILLAPGFGVALVQWIVIFLAVVAITAFLHRQFVRSR